MLTKILTYAYNKNAEKRRKIYIAKSVTLNAVI